MSSVKEFQRKIQSLKNSRKITGSMKMISSIKLQKTSKYLTASQPYRKTARYLESCLAAMGSTIASPVVDGYPEVKTVCVLLITSDRGLCGRFNMNAIRKTLQLISDLDKNGTKVKLSCVGIKGLAYLKRLSLENHYYEGVMAHPDWDRSKKVADELLKDFLSGAVQEVYTVYSKRKTSFTEESVIEKLLPFTLPEAVNRQEYLLEETAEHFCSVAATLIVESRIYECVIESTVAEHAARMSAMENASTNCDRLINKFTQLRNRARQAVITTELNEIVTGKEALES